MGFISDFTCNGSVVTSVTERFEWKECLIYQISPISERPICYSTEALKYVQTAGFFAIVATQFSNALAIKTRKLSFRF